LPFTAQLWLKPSVNNSIYVTGRISRHTIAIKRQKLVHAYVLKRHWAALKELDRVTAQREKEKHKVRRTRSFEKQQNRVSHIHPADCAPNTDAISFRL